MSSKGKYLADKYYWIKEGLVFGLGIYFVLEFLFPLISGAGISLKNGTENIVISAIAGPGFSFLSNQYWKWKL